MRLRLLVAAAAMLLSSLAARADSTFSFSFGTAGVSYFNGSGTLTGSLVAPGEYLITSVSGTTDTGNGINRRISGIETLGDFPTRTNGDSFPPNDNDLFLSSTGDFSFDEGGLSYMLKNGAQINLFLTSGELLERAGGATRFERAPIYVAPTSTSVTPEPSSFLLLGTGLLGMAGVVRKRFA